MNVAPTGTAGQGPGRQPWPATVLAMLVIAAVAVGVYGRFVGLGTWAFGVDEYYISRSVDHILNTGWPGFPCGSYYTRGLLFQYLVALVRHLGVAPELAARSVSAVWGLLTLPAAYLLGRRLQGRALGGLLVVALALSIWEIEMARYARMYAPFQAVFLWYLVFFLRYVMDGRRRAIIGMVALSLLGVLTWEGGALLGVLNLVALFLSLEQGRLRRSDWAYLLGTLLLIGVYYYAVGDPGEAAAPAADTDSVAMAAPSVQVAAWSGFISVPHTGWLLLYLAVPALLAVRTLPWVWSLKKRWLAAAGLLLALAAALTHQFVLAFALLGLLPLLGLLDYTELSGRAGRRYALALAACLLYWLGYALATAAWRDTLLPSSPALMRLLALGQYLGGFPHVFREFAVPWGRSIPGVTLCAAALLGALLLQTVRRPAGTWRAERALLVVLVVMLLAVGARESGRIETRYTFFLYPLILALGFREIYQLTAAWQAASTHRQVAAATLCLVLFGVSGDFQPRHLARIDSRAVNFRVGMNPDRASHYAQRADYRLAASWLAGQVRPGDTVALGIPTIDQYYHSANLFFLQDDDPRFDVYACSAGDRERWTNLPLIHGMRALAARAASGQRLWLLMYSEDAAAVYRDGQRRGWRESIVAATPEHSVVAILINP